jgi:hypothetical protein
MWHSLSAPLLKSHCLAAGPIIPDIRLNDASPEITGLIIAHRSAQLEQHECLRMDDGTSNSQANNPAWPAILEYRPNGSAGATPERILPLRQCGWTEVPISLSTTPRST